MVNEILKSLLDENDISKDSMEKFNFTDEHFLANLKQALDMAYTKVKQESKTKTDKAKLFYIIEKNLKQLLILELIFNARKDGLESDIILNKKLSKEEKICKSKLLELKSLKKQTIIIVFLAVLPCIFFITTKGYIPVFLSILSIIILLLSGANYKIINNNMYFTRQNLEFIQDAKKAILNNRDLTLK